MSSLGNSSESVCEDKSDPKKWIQNYTQNSSAEYVYNCCVCVLSAQHKKLTKMCQNIMCAPILYNTITQTHKKQHWE